MENLMHFTSPRSSILRAHTHTLIMSLNASRTVNYSSNSFRCPWTHHRQSTYSSNSLKCPWTHHGQSTISQTPSEVPERITESKLSLKLLQMFLNASRTVNVFLKLLQMYLNATLLLSSGPLTTTPVAPPERTANTCSETGSTRTIREYFPVYLYCHTVLYSVVLGRLFQTWWRRTQWCSPISGYTPVYGVYPLIFQSA